MDAIEKASSLTLLFLGGTCGNNNWRESFTAALNNLGVSSDRIFNPVVADWNEAAQDAEEAAKTASSHHLYYIANPKQEGINISAYSLVEATMALYDRPETTVIVFDTTEIEEKHVVKAMAQTLKVLRTRFPKANIFSTPAEALGWLVNQ